MFRVLPKLVFISILIFGISGLVVSKDKNSQTTNVKPSISSYSLGVDSIAILPLEWPSHFGFQQTGIINTSFHDNGTFGSGFANDYPYQYISFETPSYSEIEYLFSGAIWVGAVVGNDTLVSTSADGWEKGFEEFGGENKNSPSVEKIWFPSDYSMRSTFTDTSTFGISNDNMSRKPHQPLHIKITNRSHIWRNAPLNNAVFYDLLIDYFGPEDKLDSVYIGFYLDADVGHTTNLDEYRDDIAGSLRDSGLAYIFDNNGDPRGVAFDNTSPRKAIGIELLATSFTPLDTNFNWWGSSSNYEVDFSPRLKDSPEDPFFDFKTGGLGTPEGDVNKYYMLSHKEWDYDQIEMITIDSNDTDWMFPGLISQTSGVDAKILYSIGPITLVKGKTERVIFTMFTAESIHNDPFNLYNLPDDPDTYRSNLNLDNLLSVGSDIRQAVNLILDPLAPPTGLEVFQESNEYYISFDPYVFDNVVDYEVYTTPIDPSSFPFPGAIPPWYQPTNPVHVGQSTDLIPSVSIDGLTAVNVAYNSEFGISALSKPEFINLPTPSTPILKHISTTTTDESVVIDWILPESSTQPDHYEIYKVLDIDDFYSNYTKPKYIEAAPGYFTTDSIEVDRTMWYYQSSLLAPYALVDGAESKFIDNNFEDGAIYFMVSVDEFGFVSNYARTEAVLVQERTKDLLIVTYTGVYNISTHPNNIISYYQELLDGTEMSYDIYSVKDSATFPEFACTYDLCPTMQVMSKYKCVVIDEAEYIRASDERIFELMKYIHLGGKYVEFGGHTVVSIFNDSPTWISGGRYSSFFGVESFFSLVHIYNMPNPFEVGKFGFNIANSTDDRFPSLECDTSRYPIDDRWDTFYPHPTNEPLNITGFIPTEGAVVTHRYQSLYPETSYMQDMAVGVRLSFEGDELYPPNEIFTFGFHLYYMKYQDSRNLLRNIINESYNCCIDIRGNIDSDPLEQIDIEDIVTLVAYMFSSGAKPTCMSETNIDGSTGPDFIDISDLVILVGYVFSDGTPPSICP